ALLGAMGVAAALAMMAGALSLYDATDNMIGLQFRVAQRQALSVQLVTAVPASARAVFASLPGVTNVDLVRVVPIRIRHMGRSRTVGLTALDPAGRRRAQHEGRRHPRDSHRRYAGHGSARTRHDAQSRGDCAAE